ncbi:hypothetical protein [Lactiplantibacillus paraplantarum]|uniref:hypothetical protein n=1 Tax=Lactiplantibacillus paraplantarum TaxID=60520 RepID=UPI00207303A0|nr:hypothetical protein [Lactiplantibacillus paraplantarum]
MFDNLLMIDEKNAHYIKEKLSLLQHIFADESKAGATDADRLRKVLAIFMDMQENSKGWTVVTKQAFVKKIKEKSIGNEVRPKSETLLGLLLCLNLIKNKR